MAPWYIEYLKLKELGKTAEAERLLWPFSLLLPMNKLENLRWEMLFLFQEVGASLSLKTRCWQESYLTKTVLSFPQLLNLPHTPWSIIFLHALFTKPSMNTLSSVSLGLHFLMSHKIYIKYICMLFTVNLSLSV